jgi:hypothetical protein
MVEAAFLDKTTTTRGGDSNVFREGRQAFADWAVDPQNDYFATNAVNRIWRMLMGRPLVAPVDDLTGIEHAPFGSLLTQLANEFRDSDYQFIPLIRAIVLSRPYRMSSTTQADEPFASRAPRLVDSTQLVGSLRTASGLAFDLDIQSQSIFAKQFVNDDPSESLRSTVQSLMIMNGELVTKACSPEVSPFIRTLHEAPFLSDEDKIESLFLRTLSRYPSPDERQLFFEFLESGRKREAGEAQPYADLLWILINTAEFHTIT